MSDATPGSLRTALVLAIREACRAGLGVPPSLEAPTRAFARASREDGVPVEKVLIDVKAIVRAEAASSELVFMPRIIGWTVAGYFAGAPRREGK